MYKAFMTCDDPKGVVECGSIRKYRTSSKKMKDKTKSLRPAENLETQTSMTSKPDKEERVSKGSTGRSFFDPSSLQLMEVSRGAQRLNNMIGSWSRGPSYDGQSEDIAKDLLKGALGLQESLVVLHKVQEASQHLSRLKRRQNEKYERGRIDERMMIDRIHSNQFSEQSYPMRFQRPWSSADGSSSSCTEELKKVIKESLVRQNVFPRKVSEALDSASEFPSTNSSQSFGVQTERLSDSSFSPSTSRQEHRPSLVARLMGLEEAPARSFPTLVPKQLETQKIQNHKRPMFEIDLPKVRKNSSIAENVNPEGYKTVREILGTTHYSGLLKKSPVREPKFQVHHHFNDFHSKQFDDLPPIVLMKPRYAPYREFVLIHEPVPPEELSLRKLKAKSVPSKTFKPREGSINMEKEMEEYVSNRLTKEERTKRIKEVVELDAKEINLVENVRDSRDKGKLYSHAIASNKLQPQVSEIVYKKTKVKTISRKLPEKAISNLKIVTKSQDQGEICSTKLRKPQSGSRIDKNEIPSRKSIGLNTTTKPKNQKINIPKEPKKNQMKKQRAVPEPEAAKPVAEQLGEEGKIVDVSCEDDCTEIRIITTIADDLTMEHEVDASATNFGEDCKQIQSCSGDDILMLKSGHENEAIPAEESHDSTNCCESEINHKPDEEGSELKYLLLTNQSFIGHADELLNLDLDCTKILQKNESNEIANARLYLDCANELTERKSLQESGVVCSLLPTYAGNSRLHISLGKLVEEIYNAIENLTSYSEKISGKKHASSDSIYAMMERDMKCNNGVINGIWNWGWRHGFSADEAEQVVNEVENLVFSGLIEEVIVNL